MQIHPTRLAYALSIATLAFAAGCSGGSSSSKHVEAYLASNACAQNTTASSCGADSDCFWVATGSPTTRTSTNPGGPCLNQAGPQDSPTCVLEAGVCAPNDPCLALDKNGCASNTSCAWSQTSTLCPVGASCNDGGYCHSTSSSGGSCACLSPIACPANGACSPVECDCSGGGGGSAGGGGSCTCSCPVCAPGEPCAPCDCDCSGGGDCENMGGSTCACACPVDANGAPASSCDCNCGSGPVSGTDPCNQFTTVQSCEHNGQYSCGLVPGPDGELVCASTSTSSTPPSTICAQHTDQASCNADTANGCQFVADPCAPNATNCGGECVQTTTDPASVCNCPACPEGAACACACANPPVTPPSTTCPPPPVPSMGGPTGLPLPVN